MEDCCAFISYDMTPVGNRGRSSARRFLPFCDSALKTHSKYLYKHVTQSNWGFDQKSLPSR